MWRTGDRMGKKRTGLAMAVACSVLFAACGGDDEASPATTAAPQATEPAATEPEATEPEATETTAAGGSPTTAAAEEEMGSDLPAGNYRFGHIAVESGATAFAGNQAVRGIKVAVEEINESGYLGDGATIEITSVDGGAEPPTAIAEMTSFAADDEILGIICCTFSSVANAILPTVEELGMPLVVYAAISPTVTDSPNVFRSFPLSQPSHEEMTIKSIEAFAPETAVVTVTADNDGMLSERDIIVEQLEAGGVEVLATVDTFAADTEFSGPATQVIDLNPDVVYIAQLGATASPLIRELRQRGYDGEIVANLAIGVQAQYDVAGEAMDGAVFPIAFSPFSETEAAVNFIERYEAMFPDEQIDQFAAQGYQAAWMMAMGLRNGGEGTRDALLAGLGEVTEADFPMGSLVWDERGEPSKTDSWQYLQWSEGKIIAWDGTAAGRAGPWTGAKG